MRHLQWFVAWALSADVGARQVVRIIGWSISIALAAHLLLGG